MTQYELLYIIPAKHTEDEIKAIVAKIDGISKALGANVTATHDLGKRKLAYPIQHVRTGHYVLVHYDAETAVTPKLNETLRLSTDILRHLIIKRDKHLTKIPSFAEEEARRERDEEQSQYREPAHAVPAPRPAAPAQAMSMEELDKKIDDILTEEVA